jgi:hypothetical protein
MRAALALSVSVSVSALAASVCLSNKSKPSYVQARFEWKRHAKFPREILLINKQNS